MKKGTTKSLKIQYTEKNISRYAGFPVIGKFLNEIVNIRSYLEHIKVEHKKKIFSSVDLLLMLLVLPILGIKCPSRINDLESEIEIAQSIELPRWCKKSTLSEFVNKMTRWNYHQLRKLHSKLRGEFSSINRESGNIVDFDASTQTTEGQKKERTTPGYNKKSPGRLCMQWLGAFCNGELIADLLLKGYEAPFRHFKKIFVETEKIIGKIKLARMDGGFFDIEILNWLMEKKVDFLTKGRNNRLIVRDIITLYKKKDWAYYNAKTKVLDCGLRQIDERLSKPLRLIIVVQKQTRKKRIGKITRFQSVTKKYVIITTLTDLSAQEIYTLYLKRGAIENFFKETYQSFKHGYLHYQEYTSNLIWYTIIGISHNLMVWFKQQHLPKRIHWSFDTIRRKLISLPGRVIITPQSVEIKLREDFSNKNLLNLVQKNINKFISVHGSRDPMLSKVILKKQLNLSNNFQTA